MCEPGVKIKLCTCDPDEIDPLNCWQLSSDAELRKIMGSFVQSQGFREFDKTKMLKQKILDDLNGGEVFDFDYRPSNGDALKIWIEGEEYRFFYYHGQFLDAFRFRSMGEILGSGSIKMQYPY